MGEPLIRIADLRKTYHMGREEVRALDGVSLDIRENAFMVVMGPSGSGKSTLLHLVGGLDRATSGHLEVAGQALEDLDENRLAQYRRLTVGFIFQSFNLIQTMTALDNVAFPTRFARVPRAEQRRRATDLLKRVDLLDRAGHKPTELSGGQQQRVAIARAMVNDPRLILADEPTGNLDTHTGMAIMHVLSDLHKSGKTVMVVTHDTRMKHFATDVIYLLDGQIVSEEDYNAAIEMALNESMPS